MWSKLLEDGLQTGPYTELDTDVQWGVLCGRSDSGDYARSDHDPAEYRVCGARGVGLSLWSLCGLCWYFGFFSLVISLSFYSLSLSLSLFLLFLSISPLCPYLSLRISSFSFSLFLPLNFRNSQADKIFTVQAPSST